MKDDLIYAGHLLILIILAGIALAFLLFEGIRRIIMGGFDVRAEKDALRAKSGASSG